MSERLDVVGLRRPPRADVDRDVLRGRFESIKRVAQMLPGSSSDQNVVRSEFSPPGLTTRFVRSLAVRLPAVTLRSSRTRDDLEPSPTPGAVLNRFCHSDAILSDAPASAGDHVSRRPIRTKLAPIEPIDRTIVERSARQYANSPPAIRVSKLPTRFDGSH
jgi:hypothetical protein